MRPFIHFDKLTTHIDDKLALVLQRQAKLGQAIEAMKRVIYIVSKVGLQHHRRSVRNVKPN
jgi:hypothetical protein